MTETEALALAQAQEYAEANYQGDGVTGFAIEEHGGKRVLVVYVDKKKPVSQCAAPVHKQIQTDTGIIVETEVREVGQGGFRALDLVAQAAPGFDDLRSKIVGGLQITTGRGEDRWVGTLGGIFMATINGKTVYGGLTNAHVTGLDAQPGMLMCQPDQHKPKTAFGRVAWVSKFTRDNKNTMDACVIDCDVNEGYWENHRRWTVHPEQFGGYKLSLRYRRAVVGETYIKYGRTTGFTEFKCIATGATDYVNYGNDGTFGFVGMDHFEMVGGQASAGGDSGSYIVHKGSADVASHLFAGGGPITIGYPFENVVNEIDGRLAENPPPRR